MKAAKRRVERKLKHLFDPQTKTVGTLRAPLPKRAPCVAYRQECVREFEALGQY